MNNPFRIFLDPLSARILNFFLAVSRASVLGAGSSNKGNKNCED
jgi:hypothetical protein